MAPHRIECVEFLGVPLDRHVETVSVPNDKLNDIAAIPVNQNIIEMLNGHGSRPKGRATSIAVYVRQDDGLGGQYHCLRSATPANSVGLPGAGSAKLAIIPLMPSWYGLCSAMKSARWPQPSKVSGRT